MKWHGIQNWETIGGMKEINLNILYDGTRGTGDWIRDMYYTMLYIYRKLKRFWFTIVLKRLKTAQTTIKDKIK